MSSRPPLLHRRSVRLPGYDYSGPGAYFVTIVAAKRQCLFGCIEDREMILSDIGSVAEQQWMKLPSRFPNVELGAFVVMPNHLHGILVIHERRGTAGNLADQANGWDRRAPTEGFGKPVPGSIPTVIRSYKSSVAYRVHVAGKMVGEALWQGNYYEHVIRDDRDWDRIRRYIESNPSMWQMDEEYPVNHG